MNPNDSPTWTILPPVEVSAVNRFVEVMDMAVIKVPASDAMVHDLEALKLLLGATSNAEAVRRAVARELILMRALEEVSELTIRGKNAGGKKAIAVM